MDRVTDLLRRHWWVFVVLTISLIGTLKRDEHGYAEPNAWAAVLVTVAVLALLVRVRRPELTVLLNGAAVALFFGSTFADGPVYLSVFLSLFALSSRRSVRDWVPYAGIAVTAIVAGTVVREARIDENSALGSIGWTTWFIAVCAAAAAVGAALRNRHETHAEQLRRTATEEQLRMAQDLHDGVGHGLAVIAMQAGVALHVLDQDPSSARRSLEAIRDTSRESLAALRAELTRLSPQTGDPAPLAPRNGLADLEVLAGRIRAGGLQVMLEADRVTVPAAVGAVGYAVVQEALTNVLRHAQASTARVVVRTTGGALEIAVSDDGRGPAGSGEGMGIPGMRSRVEALGGTLEAGQAPERGFRVRALIPLEEDPA